MKTIVFTGGSSLLAQSWINKKHRGFNFILGIHKRQLNEIKNKIFEFNYENVEELTRQLVKVKADIVINCIGLTSVEECEEDFELAFKTNVIISGNIAQACQSSKIKLVHISTDHLFDGNLAFTDEKQLKAPLNNYGKTKSEGENIVLQNYPEALIIRTNFFGLGPSYKPSFSDKILKNLEKGIYSKLFKDVYYTPVSVQTLKEQVYQLLKKKSKRYLQYKF